MPLSGPSPGRAAQPVTVPWTAGAAGARCHSPPGHPRCLRPLQERLPPSSAVPLGSRCAAGRHVTRALPLAFTELSPASRLPSAPYLERGALAGSACRPGRGAGRGGDVAAAERRWPRCRRRRGPLLRACGGRRCSFLSRVRQRRGPRQGSRTKGDALPRSPSAPKSQQ